MTLDSFNDELVNGYGAANLLPTLAYCLNNVLSILEAVLDDDLSKATVLITAVDNVASIMTKLLQARPNHIIYPLSGI